MKYLMYNLKSNKTLKEILEYKNTLKNINLDNVNFILFPSSIYLSFFYDAPYKIGSQNVSALHTGSFTGEILAHQIKSLRVSYALINHSDASEKINDVVSKIKNVTKENIKAVLCIGEETRQTMDEVIVELKRELSAILPKLNNTELNNLIIAYEPAWAINSDIEINSEVISRIIGKLKEELDKVYNISPAVIYGGGINDKNIDNLIKCENIDGYLIGNYANEPQNINNLLNKF